jgi:hypothetical protein
LFFVVSRQEHRETNRVPLAAALCSCLTILLEENPKSESRSTKQIQNDNRQMTRRVFPIAFFHLGFSSDFEFRASNFPASVNPAGEIYPESDSGPTESRPIQAGGTRLENEIRCEPEAGALPADSTVFN